MTALFLLLLALPLRPQPSERQIPQSSSTVVEAHPLPSEISPEMLYEIAFTQLASVEHAATQRSNFDWRELYNRVTGLSGKMAARFRDIVKQWSAKTDRVNTKISTLARAEMAAGSESPSPELRQLEHERAAVLADAVDDLREALGAPLFAKTDGHLRRYIAPNLRVMVREK